MSKFEYFSYLFLILISILGTIVGSLGMSLFAYSDGIYFHNIDLVYNMCLISNDLKQIEKNSNCKINSNFREWEDRYSLNDTISYEDSYITSNRERSLNFFRFGGSCFLFGYSLCGIIIFSSQFLENWKKEGEKNG